MSGFNPVFSKELSADNEWVRKYVKLWSTGEIDNEGGGKIFITDETHDLFAKIGNYHWRVDAGYKWSWPALLHHTFFSQKIVFAGQANGHLWIFKMTKSSGTLLGWYPIQKIIDAQPVQQLKRSETQVTLSSERKVVGFLLQRIKQESSELIPLASEEMAEMIDTIRKKAHLIFNEFDSRKTSFKDVQTVLEEALADLLSLKEMLNPRRTDVITFDDILGIKPEDSEEKVKDAYKNLIQIVHPDRIPKELREKAGEITTLINSAYEHVKNNGRCA